MKNKIIILLTTWALSIGCFKAFSQITISGVPAGGRIYTNPSFTTTWKDNNQTFIEESIFFSSTTVQFNIKDANTKVFGFFPLFGSPEFPNNQYVSRSDQRWQIHQLGPYNNIRFETKQQYNTTIPPCTAIYNEYQDYQSRFGINDTAPKIKIGEVTITMTGECSSAPPIPQSIQAITMTPTSLSLPNLTTAQINSITSPSIGSLVWNLDDNCVKVYNGTSWNCL